jgi:hypothetical protein
MSMLCLLHLRVPEQVSDDIDNPTGNRMLWDSTNTNTAPNKVYMLYAIQRLVLHFNKHTAIITYCYHIVCM